MIDIITNILLNTKNCLRKKAIKAAKETHPHWTGPSLSQRNQPPKNAIQKILLPKKQKKKTIFG